MREALLALRKAAASGWPISWPPRSRPPKPGATTGEWGRDVLRAEFGIFRAPTGVSPRARQRSSADLDPLRSEAGTRLPQARPPAPRSVVGKPWASTAIPMARSRSRRALRTPAWTSSTARHPDSPRPKSSRRPSQASHCVGLSILSGSHIALTEEVLKLLRAAGLEHVPLIVGGIVPPADVGRLKAAGVAAVYTPKDFAINDILAAIVKEVEERFDAAPMVRR